MRTFISFSGWAFTRRFLPLLLFALLSVAAQAQFTYTTENGQITITGYTGPGGAVSIPSVIDGQPVTSIGGNAFAYTSLTSVTIPNSVTSIGNSAFRGCGSLTSITIPNSVTSIGGGAFSLCASLTSVTIPNSVTSIGAFAFTGCIRLTSLTIPNSVTSIGVGAFNGCASLSAITVEAANSFYSSVDGVLFDKSQTTLVQYPGGKAGSYTIPDSVTSVGYYAFRGCSSLTSVTIPNSVTSIGGFAFERCYSLTSLTIPDSVTSIGGGAFSLCASLTSVTIPNSVTSIGAFAFTGCTGLSAITVEAANSFYSSVDGVLFDKSQTTLIQYPGGKAGNYAIPNSVTSIGDQAFWNCASLTSITIPNSVTTIGDSAFQECVSLSGLTLPNSVTHLGAFAFAQCALKSLTIPSSVTNISDYAFAGCTGLTSVTIPDSVTSIGDSSFASCESLTSVTIPNSVTNIAYRAFGYCYSLTGAYFQGNAPNLGSDVFLDSGEAIVYHLAEATGWEATFAGRPTELWNPKILTTDASFGVREGLFGFTIFWASDKVVVVEACADLANPVWIPVGTHTVTGGSAYFSDPEGAKYPTRVYRLRSP